MEINMKIATNIMGFHQMFGIEKTVDIFAEAGFDGIDFNADIQHLYDDSHDKSYYTDLRKHAEDKGIVFSQAHAPFASTYADVEQTKQRFNEIVNGMRHSAWVGAEMIVVHASNHLDVKDPANHEALFESDMDLYNRLVPYAEEFGIKIAIENTNGTLNRTAEGLCRLYEELNNGAFVVCFDVGHGNIIGEDPAEMIRKLGDRIKCTHIHDNDGSGDQHTLPFYGTIDWGSVMKAFADINYTGDLSYEAGRFVKNLPDEFRPEGAKYMAKVGKLLIDKFEHYKTVG